MPFIEAIGLATPPLGYQLAPRSLADERMRMTHLSFGGVSDRLFSSARLAFGSFYGQIRSDVVTLTRRTRQLRNDKILFRTLQYNSGRVRKRLKSISFNDVMINNWKIKSFYRYSHSFFFKWPRQGFFRKLLQIRIPKY